MTINDTNIGHGRIALWAQAAVSVASLATTLWLLPVGITGIASWFISREHTQRSAIIARETGRHVTELRWWEGFTGWKTDRWADSIVPIAVSLVVSALAIAAWFLIFRQKG